MILCGASNGASCERRRKNGEIGNYLPDPGLRGTTISLQQRIDELNGDGKEDEQCEKHFPSAAARQNAFEPGTNHTFECDVHQQEESTR